LTKIRVVLSRGPRQINHVTQQRNILSLHDQTVKLQLAHIKNNETAQVAWLFIDVNVKRKDQIHKIQYQLIAIYYLLLVSSPIYFGLT